MAQVKKFTAKVINKGSEDGFGKTWEYRNCYIEKIGIGYYKCYTENTSSISGRYDNLAQAKARIDHYKGWNY